MQQDRLHLDRQLLAVDAGNHAVIQQAFYARQYGTTILDDGTRQFARNEIAFIGIGPIGQEGRNHPETELVSGTLDLGVG